MSDLHGFISGARARPKKVYANVPMGDAPSFSEAMPRLSNYITRSAKKDIGPALDFPGNPMGPAVKMFPFLPLLAGQLKLMRGGSGALKAAGKFDFGKIGSARGLAKGWGAYFTDLKGVAKSYEEGVRKYAIAGKEVNFKGPANMYLDTAVKAFKDKIPVKESTIKEMERSIRKYGEQIKNEEGVLRRMEYSADKYTAEHMALKREPLVDDIATYKGLIEELNTLKTAMVNKTPITKQSDNITNWLIHGGKTPEQYDYLRLDMPVPKKQMQKIMTQIKSEDEGAAGLTLWNDLSKRLRGSPEITGEQLYHTLTRFLFNSKKEASKFLLDAGIDGNKFPTGRIGGAANRHATQGFNYVVFDEAAVEMVP